MQQAQGRAFGPAEIYRILQDIPEVLEALAVEQHAENAPCGTRLVLLVVLRAANGSMERWWRGSAANSHAAPRR